MPLSTEGDGVPNVHVAIAKVAAAVGHIAKDQQVTSGPARYNFRGIDDVLDTMHGPLADNGVSIVPSGFTIVENTERTTKSGGSQVHLIAIAHYRIIGPAGDYVEAAALAEALDTSDKAASKAMSMAYKYVAFQVFSIPVRGALDESDRDSTPREGPYLESAPGMTLEAVHERLEALASELGTDMEGLTKKFRVAYGDLSMEQFMTLPMEKVYPFASQVQQYAERQRKQAASA